MGSLKEQEIAKQKKRIRFLSVDALLASIVLREISKDNTTGKSKHKKK